MLQIASDGLWETASVLAQGGATAKDAVSLAASTATGDVAVEALWPGQLFVGVRWSLDELDEAVAGVLRAGVVIGEAAGRAPTAARVLLALAGATPDSHVELSELGAVNAWASVGPEPLWRRGQQDVWPLDDLLARRPDLVRCAHPVAVEVSTAVPRACWVGVVVSEPVGPVHLLDLAAVRNLLALSVDASSC